MDLCIKISHNCCSFNQNHIPNLQRDAKNKKYYLPNVVLLLIEINCRKKEKQIYMKSIYCEAGVRCLSRAYPVHAGEDCCTYGENGKGRVNRVLFECWI